MASCQSHIHSRVWQPHPCPGSHSGLPDTTAASASHCSSVAVCPRCVADLRTSLLTHTQILDRDRLKDTSLIHAAAGRVCNSTAAAAGDLRSSVAISPTNAERLRQGVHLPSMSVTSYNMCHVMLCVTTRHDMTHDHAMAGTIACAEPPSAHCSRTCWQHLWCCSAADKQAPRHI